ncbi:transposase (putative), gypsy type [Artemisia annua]|uniref:Transposase (Putative), gypsy type n=1 Tax=Artemisia annua TaxID=35608 RepID=A0A2U1PUF5_ARTAN|nr:transposase (putative), gypsy type [Artemisia annua]
MSSASQEEVASGSASSDPIPKFDMHTITSVLTEEQVGTIAQTYGIPPSLHPRIPPPGMTMNRLPRDAIGIYEAYLEFSGVRVPFSTFLLQVIYYYRVHISQLVLIGLSKVILFEMYCRSMGFPPYLSLFRLFYVLQKQGHWFSFARRTGNPASLLTVLKSPKWPLVCMVVVAEFKWGFSALKRSWHLFEDEGMETLKGSKLKGDLSFILLTVFGLFFLMMVLLMVTVDNSVFYNYRKAIHDELTVKIDQEYVHPPKDVEKVPHVVNVVIA